LQGFCIGLVRGQTSATRIRRKCDQPSTELFVAHISQLPFKLIVPSDYLSKILNPDQLNAFEEFVADLEISLRTQRESICFDDLWSASTPSDAAGMALNHYMEKVTCANTVR
jgi:hypothetical protein